MTDAFPLVYNLTSFERFGGGLTPFLLYLLSTCVIVYKVKNGHISSKPSSP